MKPPAMHMTMYAGTTGDSEVARAQPSGDTHADEK